MLAFWTTVIFVVEVVGIITAIRAIMDTRTPQIVDAVKAADVFLNHDEWGMAWIAAHRAKQNA